MNETRYRKRIFGGLAILIIGLVIFSLFLSKTSEPFIFGATADLRPNTTGTYQEWDLVDTTHDGATSDQTDSTYLVTGVDEERDTQDLDATTFDAGDTIDQIEVFITCKAFGSGAKEKIATLIREGGTDTEGTAENGDRTVFATVSTVYTTNPRTASAWIKSEVDALEAGFRLKTIGNGETIQCSEIRVTVTHTTPAPPPSASNGQSEYYF